MRAWTIWLAVVAIAGMGVLVQGQVAAPGQAAQKTTPPEWVTTLIKTLEGEPVANPPARLAQYLYRGQTVYYLPPRCCDIPGTLYDVKGAVMCAPDGGFNGRGDGKCPDFFAERKNEQIIWRDTRRR